MWGKGVCGGGGERGRGGSVQKVEARDPYLGASTNLLSAWVCLSCICFPFLCAQKIVINRGSGSEEHLFLFAYFCHSLGISRWMVEPGGKGYSPCEYNPRVREAACLKGSLMPADPLQPTFTLEISLQCNGLLLATLPATPWSLSIRAVDRQFSMLSD